MSFRSKAGADCPFDCACAMTPKQKRIRITLVTFIRLSKEVFHAEQEISIGSQHKRAIIPHHRKLIAAFNYKTGMGGPLERWGEIVFSGGAAGDRQPVETTCAAMRECRF